MSIAIFLHIFSPHTLDSLLERIGTFPFGFNLYVNLVEGHSDHLRQAILDKHPSAAINVSPNQGMDPGGQLRTLHYWLTNGKDEEFLIFIHSKRVDEYRDLFSRIILPDKAKLAMQKFEDPQIGMLGVKEWYLNANLNQEQCAQYGYKQRKCRFINDDATKVDYQALLEEENFPSSPDYFSVDVDEASLIVLKKMPLDKYRFKTITIEHDAYIHGNQYKDAQADILLTHGYRRLFNILVHYPCNDTKPNCPFEDWWICPDNFNVSEMDGIAGDSLYPKEAIGRVKAWAGR